MRNKIEVLTNEGVKECYDIKPRIFNTWLIDEKNMPSTRVSSFGGAIDNLHSSICYMDKHHQDKILDMPLRELLNKFAPLEELYTFKS